MTAHTSPKNAQRTNCSYYRLELLRLCRVNEKRFRAGKQPQIRVVNAAKASIAACAARGHHDPQAGPDARWHKAAGVNGDRALLHGADVAPTDPKALNPPAPAP